MSILFLAGVSPIVTASFLSVSVAKKGWKVDFERIPNLPNQGQWAPTTSAFGHFSRIGEIFFYPIVKPR